MDPVFRSWDEAVTWLKAQPNESALVRNAYYDDPLVDAAKRYHSSTEWLVIRSLLGSRRGRVLDVGAGRGIASYAFAMDGFSVTSLEPNPSDLTGAGAIRELASQAEFPVEVLMTYAEDLNIHESMFDVVFVRAALHHARDIQSMCLNLARVLRPGGVLLAVREHVITFKRDLAKFLDKHPLHKLYGGENAYTLSEYRRALREAGLNELRTLGPLQSPVNWFPQTKATLADTVRQRVAQLPLVGMPAAALLSRDQPFSIALRMLSLLDQRPGRLYSFFYEKPYS